MFRDFVQISPEPMRCITVDSPNSMYLVSEAMIPTHNTKAGCEWVREKAKKMPGSRGMLVARTAADVRDVLVRGESGILSVCPPSEMPIYEPSKRSLTWPNGSSALCFSSEEPDQLRGVQGHWALADELAAWKYIPDDSGLNAWSNLRIATRLGDKPQVVAMTTPKRTEFMRELSAEEGKDGVIFIRGSTRDNAANLSKTYLDVIYGLYAGTRLAQQELEGLLLDDVEGALLSIEQIRAARVGALPPNARLTVIGVDPSVADRPKDECGIIVATSTMESELYKRHAYVLEDASVHGSPEVWARRVTEVARRWGAPVIAEVNQGAALVRMTLQTVDPSVRVIEVRARYGKAVRAEPIVAAYEQKRVHHVGEFPEYEDQFTSWVPGETSKSPDRVDAAVWALTALLVKQPKDLYVAPIRARSAARKHVNVGRSGNFWKRSSGSRAGY
jgi:phage terminase large subunit-like protein